MQPRTKFWLNLLDTFLALFHFSKYAETANFIVFSANICIFKPTPKKLGTLFVNTTALTDFVFVRFSCIFAFLGFLLCPFFGVFLERNEKKTKFKRNQQKGKKTTRCKQQNHLVLFLQEKTRQHRHKIIQIKRLKWKQTTQEKKQTRTNTWNWKIYNYLVTNMTNKH